MANKLNDYLMEQTILQKREWIENMEEYGMTDLNDPEFSDEKAFEATVDWVIEDLKNMRLADIVQTV
tara:strand:+ start:556 stop:756 length:201 start_codon:yes stop_codon:yes gene_type:complete